MMICNLLAEIASPQTIESIHLDNVRNVYLKMLLNAYSVDQI